MTTHQPLPWRIAARYGADWPLPQELPWWQGVPLFVSYRLSLFYILAVIPYSEWLRRGGLPTFDASIWFYLYHNVVNYMPLAAVVFTLRAVGIRYGYNKAKKKVSAR